MSFLTVLLSGAALALATVAVVHGQPAGAVEAMLSAAPRSSAADGQDARAELHAVASLRIEGSKLPRSTLEHVLTTRVGDALREDVLVHDRTALVAALVARGHLAARVTSHRAWQRDGAHVVFVVAAGGTYRVGAVAVDGALVARFPQLATVPTMLTGQAWGAERASANQTMLRGWLAQRGARSTVTMATRVDHVRLTVDVTFTARRAR